MKKFRKIWDEAKNGWLLSHKDMDRRKAYALFLEAFPDASDVTETAFNNQRSRMGAVKRKNLHSSTKCRPLYSEHLKKGYIRIKIAQPNVWVLKSKWVYMETHPWEDFSERSNYIFLDGDNRNFSPGNIERVPLKTMGVFNSLGGCVKGHPELTRLNVARAKLKQAELDAGERLGLTVTQGNSRKFRDERNKEARESQRKARLDPARNAKRIETAKKRLERIKNEEPERWAKMQERSKEAKRIWYLKNKEKCLERNRQRRKQPKEDGK